MQQCFTQKPDYLLKLIQNWKNLVAMSINKQRMNL